MKPDTENIYQRKINQVIDYINANLHLPLRLDIIAGQVNVSERQLLRIMKGALNESLYAYVARQRVERAVRDVQNPAHRLVGNIVYLIGRAAPIVNARSLEKSRCRVSGVSSDIAFPYDLLFIDCLVNVMADLTGF